jgi:stage V sporulation protein D (sporulation-specific penicillin-binding protein)
MLSRTLFLLIVCGIVAFIVLAIKLFEVQIIKHDEYETKAIEQQVRETTVTAARGTIYDRNEKILAMSASVSTIYISPAEIVMYDEDASLIATRLSEILDVDYDDIMEMTKDTSSWYKTVARKVESDLSDQVQEFKNEYNLKGVKIETDSKRYYPYSSLASHIIGYVGIDNYGLNGIESEYDDVLTGTNGRVVRAKNSAGTDMLFTKFEDYYDAEDGCDVVLTIDATIQYYLEKHLANAVSDYQVQNGAAGIVMNVKTGEILALASLGNFDLNDYQSVSEEAQEEIDAAETDEEKSSLLAEAQQLQWRNKAISDTYEPGSTFKIITLAMGLEEGVISEDDSFYCGGSVNVVGRTTPVNCWKTAGHGAQTLTNALQHSCNVAFVNIGLKIGEEKFYEYCEAFGLFNSSTDDDAQLTGKTGIDLPGESGSIWWSHNVFCDSQNYSQLAAASFGQTFNVTPIQLITAVSACVNGGYLMKPYLVSQVRDSDGNVVSQTESTVVRQVISEETSQKVCEMLEQVVGDNVEGTGKNAYVAGYRIGGKTGTSTKTTIEASTGAKEYIVSFIGVAPMDDPEIAVLVLLDNPSSSSGIYVSGGQMAAPTAGNIFADVLPYLGIEAEYTDDEIANADVTVPNIVGMSLSEAESYLGTQGLSYRVIGTGDSVTDQLPAANVYVALDSTIIIYADAEPSGGTETVPDVTGYTYSTARQLLEYYGLFIRSSTGIVSNSSSVVVSKQSIAAGSEAEYGTVIEVTLVDNDTSIQGRY